MLHVNQLHKDQEGPKTYLPTQDREKDQRERQQARVLKVTTVTIPHVTRSNIREHNRRRQHTHKQQQSPTNTLNSPQQVRRQINNETCKDSQGNRRHPLRSQEVTQP